MKKVRPPKILTYTQNSQLINVQTGAEPGDSDSGDHLLCQCSTPASCDFTYKQWG